MIAAVVTWLLGWIFPVDWTPPVPASPPTPRPEPPSEPPPPDPCRTLGHLAFADPMVCDYCGAELTELEKETISG